LDDLLWNSIPAKIRLRTRRTLQKACGSVVGFSFGQAESSDQPESSPPDFANTGVKKAGRAPP